MGGHFSASSTFSPQYQQLGRGPLCQQYLRYQGGAKQEAGYIKQEGRVEEQGARLTQDKPMSKLYSLTAHSVPRREVKKTSGESLGYKNGTVDRGHSGSGKTSVLREKKLTQVTRLGKGVGPSGAATTSAISGSYVGTTAE